MAEELEVRLGSQAVGTLIRTRVGARFRYSDIEVARRPGVPLLSASLPVAAGDISAERTKAWFTGLLPEDRQREEVQRRFGLQAGTYFDLLREIGWECAGAVTIGADRQASAGLLPLTSDELDQRLAALPAHPYDDTSALRVSLGGFQSKLLVTYDAGQWCLPLNGAASSHILKPQPADRFPGLVAAETWGMALAAEVTATAETTLLGHDGAPVTLVVTRFDRVQTSDGLEHVHQEDGAQALGVPPENKYAASGNPSRSDPTLVGLAQLIERYAEDPFDELRRLLQQVTINVAVGNTDAHAKNYGFIHDRPGQLRLSPMYDVVPALYVNPGQIEMGMRVAGILRIDRVDAPAIIAEGHRWGIPPARASSIVSDTLESLEAALGVASARYPGSPSGLHEHVRARITGLRASL
jgi:serine/threonine-protein kinase HipA